MDVTCTCGAEAVLEGGQWVCPVCGATYWVELVPEAAYEGPAVVVEGDVLVPRYVASVVVGEERHDILLAVGSEGHVAVVVVRDVG